MSIGKGSITSIQNISTASSTQSKIVDVYNSNPQVMWKKYLLQNQGFYFGTSVVYQDNKIAILLEENGRAAGSNRTKYINTHHLFIQGRVDNRKVIVVQYPTDRITGDYFTKPLQGAKFRNFRYQIMRLPDEKNYLRLTEYHRHLHCGHPWLCRPSHRYILPPNEALG